MSLINDALKRAGQSQPPPTPAPADAPLRPVEDRRASPAWLVAAIVPLVLVLACVAFYEAWRGQHSASLATGNVPVAAREQSATPITDAASAQTLDKQTGPLGSANARPALAKTSARTPAASVPSNDSLGSTNDLDSDIEPAKPTFPVVRLQGVFFRTANPLVMINAKMLRVGDKIAGVKVVAIERESVKLEWNGETKILTLE